MVGSAAGIPRAAPVAPLVLVAGILGLVGFPLLGVATLAHLLKPQSFAAGAVLSAALFVFSLRRLHASGSGSSLTGV